MATRNINSFIEHLMNEAMTTSSGGTDKTPPIQDTFSPGFFRGIGGGSKPTTIPFFTPKPTPYDQSDEDGNIIPGRGPRRPATKPIRIPRRTPGIVQDVDGARPQDYQNPNQTFPITTPPFYKP
tara:strand:- start:269 stop:640 length:372 start_codon:yes stop_codon:yes gene_type:complete